MNTMTDVEISKQLALAIGWTENRRDRNGCLDPDIAIFGGFTDPREDEVKVWDGEYWRTFDYRDHAVILPIAVRYNAFPHQKLHGADTKVTWEQFMWSKPLKKYVYFEADTAVKCIALAVIGIAK